jgi:endonuclease/exonuclease/phosphatase family metal-dependent hydrolase
LPDVIALQEVESHSWRAGWQPRTQWTRFTDALHRALELRQRHKLYSAHYFPAHRYATPFGAAYTTGLAVLVAQPLRVIDHNAERPHEITHRRLRWTRYWKQTRICAHVGVETPQGERIDLFNAHLSLPAFFTRRGPWFPGRMGHGDNQLREAEEVLSCIDARARGARVLVGDFNSEPGSPVHRLLTDSGGLRDVFAERAPTPRWPTNGIFHLRMHLDHVFACEQSRWLDFDGSHPFGHRGPFDGLSDHVPKIGRFMPINPASNAPQIQ